MGREDMLRKFEFIVNTSQEFMTMIDSDFRYVAANRSYCEAHNRKPEAVIGKTLTDIWGAEQTVVIKKYIEQCFHGREVHYEEWFAFPALGTRCFEVYCYPFVENGSTTHIVVISRDITERKKLEEKVFVDPLTGLYNYRYFNQRIEEEFERARRYNLRLSLLFADIDFFKNANDVLGHSAANDILVCIASILDRSRDRVTAGTPKLRRSDIPARFGGEEFVILLPETAKRDAAHIAERVRATVEGYDFPHYSTHPGTHITVSVGISAYPEDDIDNAGDLLRKADLAMYEAKNQGRNRVILYSE